MQQLLRREALAGTELGEHIKASFALGQALAASVSASVLRDAMGATMRGTMGPVGSARPKHFIVSDFPRTTEHLEAFGFTETAAPGRVAAVRLHVSTDMTRERCRASNEQFLDGAELCLSVPPSHNTLSPRPHPCTGLWPSARPPTRPPTRPDLPPDDARPGYPPLHRVCHGDAWQEEILVRRLLDYEAHIEPVVRSLAESSWVQAVDANGAWADVLSKVQQALAAVPGYPGPRR